MGAKMTAEDLESILAGLRPAICQQKIPSAVVQLRQNRYTTLYYKYYENGVTMTKKNLSLKCYKSLVLTILQQKKFRSFKRGTVCSCRLKGHKVIVHQTLRITQSPGLKPRLDSGWLAELFSNLQLWQLVTLQSFDWQRPTLPFLKGLNLFCWHNVQPRD